MARHRITDWVFFAYFAIQIPTTLIFDSQGVYPAEMYPGWARSLMSHYLAKYRDPFLANAWQHPWYLVICLVEHFIEVPFFCWAAYVYYYHGAERYPKILLPSLMYGVHTLTSLLGVFASALGSDFSQSEALAPRTFGERVNLCSAYLIFFVMATWIMLDSYSLLMQKPRKLTE